MGGVMMRKNAFTLIELLVVVAVIALLMSILLPSFRKAKDKVRDLICRTRLKGIGVAVLLYLQDNESRAFNNSTSNGHLWRDAAGNYITPDNASWWPDAYWALGYRAYTSDERNFSCPSFVLKNAADLLYMDRPNYQTTQTDLEHVSGYALNSFFFRDPDASGADRYNRKISLLKSPGRFIVTHDHVEPKVEGDSGGGDQGDMLYISSGNTRNLPQYRTGNRQDYYPFIFRHCKQNAALDEPARRTERLPRIDENPNGNLNVLFADGGVDKIAETTGSNIPYSLYRGAR